jgi:DMSO/TMAO reductase YedYZ molybdopterin-dependent catalytic subunit
MVEPTNNEKLAHHLARRDLLRLSPLLLAGALFIPSVRSKFITGGLGVGDWLSEAIFRRNHLAPTFSTSELTPFDQFPLNTYDVNDPDVDFDDWALTVSGDVARPGKYSLAQIKALPLQRQNTKHICVEGWDVVGRFGGARVSDFLNLVGANTSAKFLYVECADDYYESLDMPSALQPQSLLCYEMYDQPLTREHGAPLRFSLPTKLGYKSAKYLTTLRVTDVIPQKGYWEDQGYSQDGGI